MQITLTAKIRLYVENDYDRQNMMNTMRTYANACNFVSDYIFDTHELSSMKIQDVIYYDLREKYGVRSQMAISVIKTVVARYKTILENRKEWIKPDFKHPQYDLVWNRDYSLKKGLFSVNTLNGRVKSQTTSSAGGLNNALQAMVLCVPERHLGPTPLVTCSPSEEGFRLFVI